MSAFDTLKQVKVSQEKSRSVTQTSTLDRTRVLDRLGIKPKQESQPIAEPTEEQMPQKPAEFITELNGQKVKITIEVLE